MWGYGTHKHLLVLADTEALALDSLYVLQSTQDVVVDLEGHLDAEVGALLDLEGLIFQLFNCAFGGDIDYDVGPAFNLEGEGLDDACSGVVGVANRVTGVETEGGFPAV